MSKLFNRSLSLRATYRHHIKPPLSRHCLRRGIWTKQIEKTIDRCPTPNIRLEATWACCLQPDDRLLEANDALPVTQNAFRRFHSTKSAFIKVYSDHCLTLSQRHVSLLILDLSAEFDTVDFDILLKRLHDSFEIRGTSLAWLTSYITDRAKAVGFNQSRSQKVTLICGVSQESVLRPCCRCYIPWTWDLL